MVVYRVWNNHQVNYVKNDISIMHFISSDFTVAWMFRFRIEEL